MLFDEADPLTELCSFKVPTTIVHYVPVIQKCVPPSKLESTLRELGHQTHPDPVRNLTHVLTLPTREQYSVLARLVKNKSCTEIQACARDGRAGVDFAIAWLLRLQLDREPNLHRLTPLYDMVKEREHYPGFQECFTLVLAAADLIDIYTFVRCTPHTTHSVLMNLFERIHSSMSTLGQALAALKILADDMWALYADMKSAPLSVQNTYACMKTYRKKGGRAILTEDGAPCFTEARELEELLDVKRLDEAFLNGGVMC